LTAVRFVLPVVREVLPVVRVDKRAGLAEQITGLFVPLKTFPFLRIALFALSEKLSVLFLSYFDRLSNRAAKVRTRIIPNKKKSKKIFLYIFVYQPFNALLGTTGATCDKVEPPLMKKTNPARRFKIAFLCLIIKVIRKQFGDPLVVFKKIFPMKKKCFFYPVFP